MKLQKKLLASLEVEIPTLEKDQEGLLLGGFSSIKVYGQNSMAGINEACHGCVINEINCDCEENKACHGCTINKKTCPPPKPTTTTTTTGINVGGTASLSFSMLF